MFSSFFSVIRVKINCKDPSMIPEKRVMEMEDNLFMIHFKVEGAEVGAEKANGDEDKGDGDGDEDKGDGDEEEDDDLLGEEQEEDRLRKEKGGEDKGRENRDKEGGKLVGRPRKQGKARHKGQLRSPKLSGGLRRE
jgi:hypothetical protein